WATLASEIAKSGYRWRRLVRQCVVAPLLPGWLFRLYRRWRNGGRPPWHEFAAVRPEFAAASGIHDRAAREDTPFDAPPRLSARLARISGLRSYSETADWFTKLRAHFGIDAREPAFDRRLFEFCLGIPEDQYLRKGQDRWLIRRAMRGRLPAEV